jgi:hypothetical protein
MEPAKTWKVDKESQRIVGSIDGADAYWQFVQKALSTEKYYWYDYDQSYGIRNIERYIGKDRGYIEAHFPIDVEDCVMTDDRTDKVDNYQYEEVGTNKLKCSCRIWYKGGGSQEVSINVRT